MNTANQAWDFKNVVSILKNETMALEITHMFLPELITVRDEIQDSFNEKNWDQLSFYVEKLCGILCYMCVKSAIDISRNIIKEIEHHQYDKVSKELKDLDKILDQTEKDVAGFLIKRAA